MGKGSKSDLKTIKKLKAEVKKLNKQADVLKKKVRNLRKKECRSERKA